MAKSHVKKSKTTGERTMSLALLFSLIIGGAVGISAGYLGSIMVLEKMALVGDALSHVALPGLALGIIYGFDPFYGAFAFLFAAAVLIWQVGRVTKLSYEAIVGAAFTLALAIGIIIIPSESLLEALFGDITKVMVTDALAAIVIAIVSIFLTRIIYRKIVLSMISEDLAVSSGVNVPRTNLLFLLLVSLVVSVGIKIVGTLLVGFLVIVPAASSKNLSQNLFRYGLLSGVFGAASALSGVTLSSVTAVEPGPLVVLSGMVIFAATIFARWIRK